MQKSPEYAATLEPCPKCGQCGAYTGTDRHAPYAQTFYRRLLPSGKWNDATYDAGDPGYAEQYAYIRCADCGHLLWYDDTEYFPDATIERVAATIPWPPDTSEALRATVLAFLNRCKLSTLGVSA